MRSELAALSLVTGPFQDKKAIASLQPCYQAEAFLLAADIAVGQERTEDAKQFLERWHDCSMGWDYGLGEAFGLISIAGLLCDGVLAKKHRLSKATCQRMVKTLIGELKDRLRRPEPPKPPRWKYTTSVFYNQFYLEPLNSDLQAVYFQQKGESEQGFSSFPHQVAFGTPTETGECRVEVEFRKKLPPIKGAVQTVAVPLTVEEPGGLYLRTVVDSGNKMRFDVPSGQYDVLARFFLRGCDEETFLRSWQVVLTFLPKGTVGAKCLGMPAESRPD
jgi:hypothetical protein